MEIKESLASALCKAQSEFTPAAQSGYNPHFKNTFSSMTDLIKATRPALKKYGLTVTQYPDMFNDIHVLVTKIKFNLEEEVSRTPICLEKQSDDQSFGKSLTYKTRYVYKNMLGVEAADECEDDGNASAGITKESAPSNLISEKQLDKLKALLKSQPGRESTLLLHYKIDDLSKLPWKYMNQVVDALKPKE